MNSLILSKKKAIVLGVASISIVLCSYFNFPGIFMDSFITKYIGIISFLLLNFLVAIILMKNFNFKLITVFILTTIFALLGIVIRYLVEWNEDSVMQFFNFPIILVYVLSYSIYITTIVLHFKRKNNVTH